MRRGGGPSSPLSPSVEFCRTRGPVEPRPLSTGEPANDTSGFPGSPRQRGPCLAGGGRFLHETLLLGSRSALWTTEHAEAQKIAIWRPRPGDPLTMTHPGPPDSIRLRVGRPFSRGVGAWPRLSESGLSHRGRLSRGRPLLHETLLLGSGNALRTTEHAETQKIAILRPRPGDPLTMSHFGPPDSIRRRVGRPLSRRGAWPRFSEPARRAGRPFTRLSGLSHRGRESRRKAAFARNASAGL